MRNWQLSQIGAIRSGQPYTVYASGSFSSAHVIGVPGLLNYNRANLVDASALQQTMGGPNGGVLRFNPAAFADPVFALGSPGRNALTGPGLYSVDLSVSRSFAFPPFGESARVILRVDAYNAFNHANLNNPSLASSSCCMVNNPAFGAAYYGRLDQSSNLPVISPLNETARQLQLMLKIVF
jgi:hypothetical protein